MDFYDWNGCYELAMGEAAISGMDNTLRLLDSHEFWVSGYAGMDSSLEFAMALEQKWYDLKSKIIGVADLTHQVFIRSNPAISFMGNDFMLWTVLHFYPNILSDIYSRNGKPISSQIEEDKTKAWLARWARR